MAGLWMSVAGHRDRQRGGRGRGAAAAAGSSPPGAPAVGPRWTAPQSQGPRPAPPRPQWVSPTAETPKEGGALSEVHLLRHQPFAVPVLDHDGPAEGALAHLLELCEPARLQRPGDRARAAPTHTAETPLAGPLTCQFNSKKRWHQSRDLGVSWLAVGSNLREK